MRSGIIPDPQEPLRQQDLLKCHTEAQRHREKPQVSASLYLCASEQFSRIW